MTLKEKKIHELQEILSRKDSAVNDLRTVITDALIGFDDEDLTVNVKGGKVYVSLSEQLLFKSGSSKVDPKGSEAIEKLAGVLKNNKEIQVLIEGHTDNVPLSGKGDIKDNWDLSVKRATSIVRILQNNKIDAKRIVASGRGEFMPVASNDSPDGRSKNRRTEIILSPKLDEVFKILNIEQ
jgi:chemotaxis protein MotB